MTRFLTRICARHLSRKAKRALDSRQRLEKMERDQMTACLREYGRSIGKLS